MISESRVREFLDYATVYGQFDEMTPNGTLTDPPNLGSPMNNMRRSAILAYKRVLDEITPEQAEKAFELFDDPIFKDWETKYMPGRKNLGDCGRFVKTKRPFNPEKCTMFRGLSRSTIERAIDDFLKEEKPFIDVPLILAANGKSSRYIHKGVTVREWYCDGNVRYDAAVELI